MRRHAVCRMGVVVERNIVMIPLERFEERYTSQWFNWFEKFMKPTIVLDGHYLTSSIEDGSFLDVCGTNYFKAYQLKRIVEFIYNRKKASDMSEYAFFFMDLWFPGIEMLAYIRSGLNLKFKITGCLHAGTYDPADFLSQKGMGYWGKDLENSWFRFIDKIFVATNFHKNLIVSARDIDPNKIAVTGFPIYDEHSNKAIEKKDIVVFPHRIAPEKNPKVFEYLKLISQSEWEFVYSKEFTGNKEEYYHLLNMSKIAVSFADQETWGIAMQEALFADCLVLVPDKLSYKEMYSECFKFSGLYDAVDRLMFMTRRYETYQEEQIKNKESLLLKGRLAIRNMKKEILSL